MKKVYLVKHSENDISSKRGIDWFAGDTWMVTEGHTEGLAQQEPSEYHETMLMLKYFGVIEFEELASISELRAIHPRLVDYPPDQPDYEPITTDD